jgi:DnaK suppressor protein
MDRLENLESKRDRLKDQIVRVEHQLVELRELRSMENDDDEHDPEGVSLASEWSRLEGLRLAYTEDLEHVTETIDTLQRGGEVLCEVCHQPIDPARIEALPEATRCIHCAI